MALTTKQRAKQLENLLNAVERGNKRDASDYTSGFLNESNLYKPPEFSNHKDWEGAKKGLEFSKPTQIPRKTGKAVQHKRNGMTDVLTQFSLGNDGFLPSVKKKPSIRVKKEKGSYWTGEANGSIDEQALIEELDSRRFMLNRSQPTRLHRSWAIEDEENSTSRSKTKSVPPQHEFFNIKSGATKHDQYRDFKLFENETIRKQDALVSNVLSGEHGVLHIEQDLNKKLMALGTGPGTSFHRLQAHNHALQEIIESSPLFSYLLKQIKTEYDDYVGWLLDTHPTQSHILREQVNDLYEKGISNPGQLEQVREDTMRLESEGQRLLDINDKLRQDMKKEMETNARKRSPDQYSRQPLYSKEDKSHFDLADQLQDLHATILEKMDKLEEMRDKIREDHVPSSVCQNLEQCLKDTEVELQKLLKQNEIMESSILEMEEGISSAVEQCDVSAKDKQLIRKLCLWLEMLGQDK
ncbi:uncharacterized protein C6orf118-like isoform X2 [Watersipora subatra]|uniref:uncharacterized protein C6orf118-like isoform X2 n=1 Tax=Watersipora subatra TaxID=2589382 RepID=UPI00355ADAD0